LFSGMAEDFITDKKYDVVLAEGIIPGLYQRKQVIAKISELTNRGGVTVVTCVDDISFFFELLKRIIAHYYLERHDIKDFFKKVEVLSHIFSLHLKKMKFASRPVKDWVMDNFFNPAIYGKFFSVADCIKEFKKDFVLLGSSPGMFTNYSWYKDLDFDYNKLIIEQFNAKRHVLLMCGMPESIRDASVNRKLAQKIFELRKFVGGVEDNLDKKNIKKIIIFLKDILYLVDDMDASIVDAINEAIRLLMTKNLSEADIYNATKIASVFGRGQQYVSMVKKCF